MPSKSKPALELTPDLVDARQSLDWLVAQLNPFQVRYGVDKEKLRPRDLPLDEARIEFRRQVSEWQETGCNLREMFHKNPSLNEAAGRIEVSIDATDGGGASLRWSTRFAPKATPNQRAMGYFLELVTNPLWQLLTGPCKECAKYFVRASARDREYCSRKCSSRHTARVAGRQRIERERARKICIAQARHAYWTKGSQREDWKRFLARHPELTMRWITTAVARGDLSQP